MERIALGQVHTTWASTSDAVIAQAIDRYRLYELGWMGFDKLDWVSALLNAHPETQKIALTCSVHRPGYVDQVRTLFDCASGFDRLSIFNYFAGKLALEELSCRRSGAAGGMCDKKAAFLEIWQYLRSRMESPVAA